MSSFFRPQKLMPATAAVTLLDRDHSIFAFNERVLDWARRKDVPPLERLRYLCIVSSNLDEFFEVRAEPHLVANQRQDAKGNYTVASFERLAMTAHTLVASQYALYNNHVMPTLEAQGIKVVSHGERNEAQRRWVKQFFEREVRGFLTERLAPGASAGADALRRSNVGHLRMGLLGVLHQVEGVDIGLGRGHQDVGIGAIAVDDAPTLLQAHGDLALGVGALGDGVDRIQLQAGRGVGDRLDGLEGRIHRA